MANLYESSGDGMESGGADRAGDEHLTMGQSASMLTNAIEGRGGSAVGAAG